MAVMPPKPSEVLLRNVMTMFVNDMEEISDKEMEEVKLRSRYKTIRDSFKVKSWQMSLIRSKSTEGTAAEIDNRIRLQRRAISASPHDFSPLVLPRPVPAPLVVEDPPSSDNASDLEEVKQHSDPALLNGSSNNFGSAGAARSAPSTPQGLLGSSPGAFSDALSQPSSPGYITPSIQRSPSHNIFSKYDKGTLKQLSSSTPVMTAQAQAPDPPSPKSSTKDEKNTTSKARQKKFHRQFPLVDEYEKVLNHYSCALLGDILLQGQLYITSNYFAFYSNVFGYVTKLLIPLLSVEKITKEKTAKIIPNAIGIKTAEDKHVFGSLMSRDNTYRYMHDIWERARTAQQLPEPPVPLASDSDSSETREESGRESAASEGTSTRFSKCIIKPDMRKSIDYVDKPKLLLSKKYSSEDSRVSYFTKQRLLLFASTLILVLLFFSAAVLLYRISRIQQKYTLALQDNFAVPESEDVYSEILQWQTHLHSKSAGAVHSFIDTNLDQIAKVRQSLEALSTLLMPNDSNVSNNSQPKKKEVPADS